jgi:hypothetical protein
MFKRGRLRRTRRQLLKKVAKRGGELSLKDAIEFPKAPLDHPAQYPLALLIEEGYLGSTLDHQPPAGAEKARDYSLAVFLHMFTLPKDGSGVVHYHGVPSPQGVRSSGKVDPGRERVFLKAKGVLYLDQFAQKRWDRFWAFLSGGVAGVIVGLVLAGLRKKLGLP